MNREQASEIVGLLADRHVEAAARYAPPAASGTPERNTTMKLRHIRRPILIAAVFAMLLALAVTAYAVDLAGFRQTVRVWLHAERQEVELWDTSEAGVYTLIFPDGEKYVIRGGKGTEDGTTVPMSAEEILELWENNFEIQSDSEGRVWFCCRDGRREITELFDENGMADVTWQNGENTLTYRVKNRGDGTFDFSLVSGLPVTAIPPET